VMRYILRRLLAAVVIAAFFMLVHAWQHNGNLRLASCGWFTGCL